MSFFRNKTRRVCIEAGMSAGIIFFLFGMFEEGIFFLLGGVTGLINLGLLSRNIGHFVAKSMSFREKIWLFVGSALRFVIVGFFLYWAVTVSKWCLLSGMGGYLLPTFIMMLFPLKAVEYFNNIYEKG